jgi:phage terminase small subunit
VAVGKVEKRPKMPSGLCAAAERLWHDTVKRWEVDDSAALSHLAAACRSLSRLRKLERLLEVEGSLIRNRFGQQVRHPAHVVAMAEARNFREAMAALQLDIESLYAAEEGD